MILLDGSDLFDSSLFLLWSRGLRLELDASTFIFITCPSNMMMKKKSQSVCRASPLEAWLVMQECSFRSPLSIDSS